MGELHRGAAASSERSSSSSWVGGDKAASSCQFFCFPRQNRAACPHVPSSFPCAMEAISMTLAMSTVTPASSLGLKEDSLLLPRAALIGATRCRRQSLPRVLLGRHQAISLLINHAAVAGKDRGLQEFHRGVTMISLVICMPPSRSRSDVRTYPRSLTIANM
jgi:hypothetical protein